ncbi:MAG TPA: hypothetical protein VNS58_08980 [Puia sp.]|nr:hypothetical protein [Puia sp.]
MIKHLIHQLSNDQISLSQALTKAKLIASAIEEDSFQRWIIKEIDGYDYEDVLLPQYRKIPCRTCITFQLPYCQPQTQPIETTEEDNLADLLNQHTVQSPIAILEDNVRNLETTMGHIPLPPSMLRSLEKLYGQEIKQRGGVIHTAHFEVGKIHMVDILNRTKQKLLDNLLQLQKKYPNLKNEFMMEENKSETVSNIITNHIHGDHSPVTIAAGQTAIQKDINITLTNVDYSELQKLGVSNLQVEELKEIVKEHKNDKPTLTSKVGKWMGNVTTSLVTQGLIRNLPQITEFIQHHLHI